MPNLFDPYESHRPSPADAAHDWLARQDAPGVSVHDHAVWIVESTCIEPDCRAFFRGPGALRCAVCAPAPTMADAHARFEARAMGRAA